MTLEVDGTELAAQVAKFEALEQERAAHEGRVAQIGAELEAAWHGYAGDAMQKALADYLSASAALRREEQEMNQKMDSARRHYSSTDDDQGQNLQSAMHI
jgi:predicted  nucleic acid-binding Zn-ribbon protein